MNRLFTLRGIYLNLFVLMLFLSSAFSQVSWKAQSLPEKLHAEDIFFVDKNHGWATGEERTILYTDNGGESWESRNPENGNTIYASYFHDASNGWAVADDGSILVTNNGGEKWDVKDTKETYLLDIQFVDASNGWIFAGEGYIYHTANGGDSWEEQETGQWADFYAGHFFDALKGVAVGYSGFAIYTTNGGETWSKATNNSGNTLMGLCFIDENNGWAGGEELVLKTSDGGQSWTTLATVANEVVNDIHFINALEGWAVTENITGDEGKILYTDDGGESWTPYLHNINTTSFKSIAWLDNDNVWIAGREGSILTMIPELKKLQTQALDNPENLMGESNFGTSVALSDDYLVVGEPGNSAGYMHLYHKEEGSWQALAEAIAPPWEDLGLDALGSSLDMDGMRIISGAYGAGMGFEGKAAIWSVDNEQGTPMLEDILELPAEDKWLFAFYGYSVSISGDVAVVGARNTGAPGGSAFIYERDNENNNWPLARKISAADADGGEFFGHCVSVSGNRILVGAPQDSLPGNSLAGAVYVFEKVEGSWTETAKLSAETPVANGRFGHALDIEEDYAVIAELNQGEANAYIYHYNGESWEVEAAYDGFDVATDNGNVFMGGIGVSISDMQVVVGADTTEGTGAVTLFTKDNDEWGSSAIIADDLNIGDGFGFSVSVSNGNIAVGAPLSGEGAVYIYDQSITAIEDPLISSPQAFQLQQNYPNPFNPSTTISFSIHKNANVSLKIFDILGRQVAELLNDNLAAGNYSTIFDAANLASGIYFYSLQVDGRVQTRKLNVLK